jgi:hypothetical protein
MNALSFFEIPVLPHRFGKKTSAPTTPRSRQLNGIEWHDQEQGTLKGVFSHGDPVPYPLSARRNDP